MTDTLTRGSICDFHTNDAGSAGSTQSAIMFSTDEMYIVTVANPVALQVPSAGTGLYRVHSYSIGLQLMRSKTKYKMLKTVTKPRIVQMVIWRQRLRGQMRSKNRPTLHLVSSDMTI